MDLAIKEIAKVLVEGGRMIMNICREQVFGGRSRIKHPVAESLFELGKQNLSGRKW